MKYRIIVNEIGDEQVEREDWKKWTDDPNEEEPYKYVKHTVTQETIRQIYNQEVEKLDLKKVIEAVNAE